MEKEKESSFSWILNQAKEDKGGYILSVIMAILGVACQIGPYFIVGEVIRHLMAGYREQAYYLLQAGIICSFWLGRVLFHAISTTLSHKATFKVLGEIRKKCTEKLARMPLGDVLNRSSGTLKNIIVERVDSIETILAHIVPEFTANLTVPIIVLIYLFILDWRMALASLLTVPVGLFCYMGMMVGYEESYRRTVAGTRNLNNTAVEYIQGMEVIKVFGKTETSYSRFVEVAKEAAAGYIDWMRNSNIYFTFAVNILPATLLTILPIGGLLVMHSSLSPEKFIMIIILSLSLISPLITAMSYTDDLGVLNIVVDEIRDITDAKEMVRPAKIDHMPKTKDITLTKVRFGYGDKEVIQGIDLEIKEGSFVALVGPSGSGKSTIARLIAGLWDVDSGMIQLGGVDIRKIPLEDYSDYIAYVSQNNYLFNQTIRENIRIGKTDGYASDEEVEQVAKMSGCHDFIMSLEKGYDTVVGVAGGHLSGGERQRITIARAMLKNAPIVILDEATAYTDPESEALIQASVARLVQNKTLIVIAHRLSTIKDADQIFLINQGLVEDQGRHEELLAHQGLYNKMWQAHIAVKDRSEGGSDND